MTLPPERDGPSMEFSHEEQTLLKRFFTNTDRPVFGVTNLSETVKGALFARYSRSPKSIRRLFLDEFWKGNDPNLAPAVSEVGDARAAGLYNRVLLQYGDDSVAQLGAVHIACEQVSNILTKILERGRLATYLEQSTRYIYYDTKIDGRYQYVVPPEIEAGGLSAEYEEVMDRLFSTYSAIVRKCADHFTQKYAEQPQTGELKASIRAQACDIARGLLPAATKSNLGIFANGQALERLIMRLKAHPLQEANDLADQILTEARKLIPGFLTRVDLPDRGVAWTQYMSQTRQAMRHKLHEADVGNRGELVADAPEARSVNYSRDDETKEVRLVDYDPDAEVKVAAAIIYEFSESSYAAARVAAEKIKRDGGLPELLKSYCGQRLNRRHLPGRAMEEPYYRFDILSDYGSFRDLQRHRILTMEWQRLTTRWGYREAVPVLKELQLEKDWNAAMESAGQLYKKIANACSEDVAQYVVPFAYKLRYTIKMNARAAFHLLELRTSEQGHPDYRRICGKMYELILEQANHRSIAQAMQFVNLRESGDNLTRMNQEKRARKAGRQLNLEI